REDGHAVEGTFLVDRLGQLQDNTLVASQHGGVNGPRAERVTEKLTQEGSLGGTLRFMGGRPGLVGFWVRRVVSGVIGRRMGSVVCRVGCRARHVFKGGSFLKR